MKGSGPDGAISRADVEASATTSAPPAGALRGARKTMAMNMARAWREVVHATLHDQADIDGWTPHEDVTVRLIRAIVAGCTVEPSLNANFNGASLSLRQNAQIDLGLAIDSPDGLFVPVLRDVGRTDVQEWRRQIDAAKKGVSERSLSPGELRGATMTLSNFGTIAGQHAALIIVPPQVAISAPAVSPVSRYPVPAVFPGTGCCRFPSPSITVQLPAAKPRDFCAPRCPISRNLHNDGACRGRYLSIFR